MEVKLKLPKLEKHILIAVSAVTVIIAITIAGLYYYNTSKQGFNPMGEAVYPIKKTIRYSFLLKNTSNQLIKQAEFKSYAPVKQTASQQVKIITASEGYEISTDPLGNQVMTFNLINIPPYGSKVITITAQMNLADSPNASNEYNLDDYLQQEPFIEVDHPQIRTLAERLSNNSQIPVSKTTYDWVAQHINYSGYVRADQGALYALEKGKGDCTEYMYLATALLRASNIPTRAVAGFVVSSNSVLKSSDYHNWAEYYQSDRWHLLDAQKQVLDTHYQNYIAFRILGKKEKDALSQSQRFISYDPRLEVKMN